MVPLMTTDVVPAGLATHILGSTMAAPTITTAANSQSSLAKFVRELTVNATHDKAQTGEGKVMRILQ